MVYQELMIEIINRIKETGTLSLQDLHQLLETESTHAIEYLHQQARAVADAVYGKRIFIRGLIEFTNYCKNDCYYCGIRCSNSHAQRYRLTKEEILSCCQNGYDLGFRTFVLQGGEDPYYTNERICDLVSSIKKKYPDCAVTS